MNRSRLLIIAVLALALGAFVAYSVSRTLDARTSANRELGLDTVIAAGDIQVGQRIEDKDLKVVKLPASDLPQNVFRQKGPIVGRGAVLPIVKGELVLPSKLAAENAGSGLPSLIPPGMRAVSVRVTDVVAVAGFVGPGTRVDVLVTGNPGGSNEAVTKTVLENVAVLAAGQRLERNSGGEAQSVPVITLLVSPDDAQKLTLAGQEGRIQLALRNPLDTGQTNLEAVKRSTLYGRTGAAPPPSVQAKVKRPSKVSALPPPPSYYTVEVIKGDKRDVVKF
jgi:pilus assembly protein CpaB